MTTATIRCAIYTRKSSEEGLDQSFNSLDAQREACLAYIQSQKQEGWTAAKECYDDGGFSGGNMDRPALKRLLTDIEAGEVETVVVYKVDRLTRSLSDFAKIIEVFDSHHASFVSVTQQFNTTTSMGRLTLNVLLSFAQFERELTGERIRDKIAASKRKGMWMGGVVPLGYDRADRHLVINDAEAETVRKIFRQYLRLGCVSKLKAYLEEKQIRSKVRTRGMGRTSGGVFYSRGALHHLLKNRIYIGDIVHGEQSYPGQHEPIILRELWDKVQALLHDNNRGHRARGPAASSPSLLTGILRDTAGLRFSPTTSVKKGKRYRYYTSQAAIHQKSTRPGLSRIPAEDLEALVSKEIQRLLGSLDKHLKDVSASPELEAVITRGRAMANEWPNAALSKRHDFLRTVLSAVVVGEKQIRIEVDRTALVVRLGGLPTEGSPTDQARIRLAIPFEARRRGVEIYFEGPGSTAQDRDPIPALLKAVARAHNWRDKLVSGEAKSVEALAREEGLNPRYFRRVLECAKLSPSIIEAILAGRQPRHLTLATLYENVPVDWTHQHPHFRVENGRAMGRDNIRACGQI